MSTVYCQLRSGRRSHSGSSSISILKLDFSGLLELRRAHHRGHSRHRILIKPGLELCRVMPLATFFYSIEFKGCRNGQSTSSLFVCRIKATRSSKRSRRLAEDGGALLAQARGAGVQRVVVVLEHPLSGLLHPLSVMRARRWGS